MLSAIEPPAITGDGEMNEIRELSVNKVKKYTVNGVFICKKKKSTAELRTNLSERIEC